MISRLKVITAVLSAAILLSGAVAASAQNTKTQENKKARLEKEISVLESQLKANSTKSSNVLSSLKLTRQKIEARKELILESEREISGLDSTITITQHGIDSLQARLDTMTYYYNKLVRSSYKNRDARVWYMYILASESVTQGLRRYSYLRNLSKEMNNQGKAVLQTKHELEEERASLQAMRSKAQQLRSDRLADMDKLKNEESASEKLAASLQKDRAKYQKQLDADRKAVQALNKEIARIIAESMKGDSSKGKNAKPKKPVDYTLGKEFSSNKGKLPWPCEGPVVERFGAQYHPVYKSLKLPDSDGISIAVEDGTQVKAVFNGEVKNVIVMQGYNKCVLVQHGDWFTFYCKLGQVSVKAGDKVTTGQVLGTVEPLGGQSQLHFQIWSSKGPQNPLPWLRPR